MRLGSAIDIDLVAAIAGSLTSKPSREDAGDKKRAQLRDAVGRSYRADRTALPSPVLSN